MKVLQSLILQLQTRRSDIVRPFKFQHRLSFLFVLTSQLLGEVYYLLYDNYEKPSKAAFDPEEPALGRIRVDSVTPPHSPITIKSCISRLERTPEIASANLFAHISCDTPLKEDHIAFLCTDYPGLSPKNPMAIVLTPVREAPLAMILDGRYLIRNRAAAYFWNAAWNPIKTVTFCYSTIDSAKDTKNAFLQVNDHSPIIQGFR